MGAWFGGNPYYEDEERITFSEDEWEIMLADPSFGYVCQRGHSQARWNQSPSWDGTCYTCENEAEAAYYEWEARQDEEARLVADREDEDMILFQAEQNLLGLLDA